MASSTTSAVTRSIPRSSARRSARPQIRLIICGMPSDAAAIRSTASRAKGWAPPLTVRQRKSRYPRDTVGVERRQTEADRFAGRRAAEPQRVELRLEQGLAHQQDPEVGAHDEERIEGDRAGRSTAPAPRRGPRRCGVRVRRRPGGPASRRGPAGDPRSPSAIPSARARPRAGAAAWSCPVPGGPVRTASGGASFSRAAIRR